ncbi:MAG: hypothetical protein RMX96_25865 [Nostoc sp. ChiSLP02]|nr:hypothetical protein [Nostoc sp. DedSLP05]MDZ8101633.1 hypothetical protein [Nostoc sp. DedSLP01]MDZ8188268.1 hypothetical protein [Nostoc sp. ChiSLP02]
MINLHVQTARRAVGVSSQQPIEETVLHAIASQRKDRISSSDIDKPLEEY